MASPGRHGAPAVSVIIPCYKHARYLGESVESVLQQSFTDWEIVIVDDGSPDDTGEVARSLIARHPSRDIKLLQQANQGLGQARNNGIRASSGRTILPLDADDRLAETMLESAVQLLAQQPDVSIAYTDVQLFGVQTHRWNTGPFTLEAQMQENRIPYCSLYRREVWEAVGGYDPTRRLSHEDWEFWLHALKRGFRGGHIAQPLFHYRTAAHSMVTECNAQRPKMLSILVLNHPHLFTPDDEAAARKLLGNEANPVLGRTFSPAVSVIVTTRGFSSALETALRSILAQEFRDFEIIVVNDGGTPIDKELLALDPAGAIVSLRTGRARGAAAARNLALKAARGRAIAYLQEQDVYLPDHLGTLVKAISESKKPVVYSAAHRLTLRGAHGVPCLQYAAPKQQRESAARLIHEDAIPLSCLMHERRCVEETGGVGNFDESLGALEGWDLASRLAQHFGLAYAARATCLLRETVDNNEPLHRATANIIRRKQQRFAQARYRELLPSIEASMRSGETRAAIDQLEGFIVVNSGCAEAHNDLAVALHAAGRAGDALASALRAVKLDPASPAILCTLIAILISRGELESAARVLAPALQRHPQHAELNALAKQIGRLAQQAERARASKPKQIKAKAGLLALAFSRDRQMQLDATLRSFQLHWRDAAAADLKVLTKATNEQHRILYQQLGREHPRVELIDESDFRAQLLDVLAAYEQVLFLVDDNLAVRPFHLAEASRALRAEPRVLGVSLRLGLNTNYCYAMRAEQRVPEMTAHQGLLRFRWTDAQHDFAYPLEVSSSLYRAPEMLSLLARLPFRNPNELEAQMARRAGEFASSQPELLCFERSVTFCNPINMVQTTYTNNRAGNAEDNSAAALARRYAAGERVRVEAYRGFVPTGCHQEVPLEFEANPPLRDSASSAPLAFAAAPS